jgi:hypothetical protein
MPNSDDGSGLRRREEAEQVIRKKMPILNIVWLRIRPQRAQEHAENMILGFQKLQERLVAFRRVAVGVEEVQGRAMAGKVERRQRG